MSVDAPLFAGWEPFSALSHLLGAILALAGTVRLLVRCRGDKAAARRASLAVYGITLVCCMAASTAFHTFRGDPDLTANLLVLDRVCVFGLIAGTITPIAGVLAGGVWRRFGLAWAWSFATLGSVVQIRLGDHCPLWLATGMFLVMGWGVLLLILQVARVLPRRGVDWIIWGGVLYTIGAICNLAEGPVIWPGVIEGHEVFHVFVLWAAAAHYRFMDRYVASLDWIAPSAASTWLRSPGDARSQDAAHFPIPRQVRRAGPSADSGGGHIEFPR